MGELFRRIRYLSNHRRLDAELRSDMEFHREMAASAGRRHLGNRLRMRERRGDGCGLLAGAGSSFECESQPGLTALRWWPY